MSSPSDASLLAWLRLQQPPSSLAACASLSDLSDGVALAAAFNALAPPHLCDARFRAHVVRFVGDTLALALSGGRERGGFTCARDLLDDDDGARSRATE